MRNRGPVFITLTVYFFRRFFENDVIEASGDTLTTVVRALSIVAAPGLLLGFFMQIQYPQRAAWGRIEDHYIFVLYSLLVMAGVAIFEWEMLFPDKLDFLVLSPLPLRRRETMGAKTAALGLFLGLFLFAANVFGALLLPAVSKDNFWRQLWAHSLAVACSGAFGALAILAAGGLLICILPARAFRVISPILQTLVAWPVRARYAWPCRRRVCHTNDVARDMGDLDCVCHRGCKLSSGVGTDAAHGD
jgi:hypothetical protein